MSTEEVIVRKPVEVPRAPITTLTEAGHHKHGSCFVFDNPNGMPTLLEVVSARRRSLRELWCPYCAEFHYFRVDPTDRDVWVGIGPCRRTTKDYWVRYTNNLWYEGVPYSKVKELSRMTFIRR